MDATKYERVTELFQAMCDLPRGERDDALDRACNGDDELRTAVDRLLASDDESRGFLEPTPHARPPRAEAQASNAGKDGAAIRRVGRYRIVGELGRGGMGVVLRAIQETPRREVAIKLIKPELFGRSSDERLEREAEMLGRLRHPGIAPIIEAGRAPVVDADGASEDRPFIAMELVEGRPLNEFAESQELSTRDRVRILADLCEALQHAHQRGVVHLDLKPANILVDEHRVARVLDFGVAKALDHGVEARLAEGGSVVGTLAYMPPEQLTGHLSDLDTRADIFALGAVGFELLTGQPPRRMPSMRVEARPGAGDAHQAARDALLGALVAPTPAAHEADPGIDQELSAVLARAMAPDRENRYASIGQLGTDLRRWLAFEPVEARDAGIVRRARLLARRHRPAVVAGSMAALIALGALGLIVASMINAHALADREREATRAAELAIIEAEAEAERAGRMGAFLQNAIFGVDPEEVGPDASFFDALEYASRRIHRDLADAPLVEAEVRYSLGFVYRRHSMFGPARRHIEAALRTWREQLGEAHPKTIAAAEEVAYLMLLVDGQAEAAADRFQRILELQAAEGRAESAEAGWQHLKLGRALLALDRPVEARTVLRVAGDLLARHYGEPYRARAMAWDAHALLARGQAAEAVSTAREALASIEGASEQAYAEAHVRTVLARALVDSTELDEARLHVDEAFSILNARLPDDHIDIADAHEVAARLELAAGDNRAAADHAEAVHRIRSSRLGPDHPDLISAKALRTMASIAPEEPLDAMLQIDDLFHNAEQLVGADHRLALELLEMSIRAAQAGEDSLAARNKTLVMQDLRERRSQRLGETN
ncbi:MAG: serine/threonine-protein kinase [Phycisphaerales bacterium]|jgi:predicted Ser/Thr protein kinase/tetratricopeptide (TPR) repeat protein